MTIEPVEVVSGGSFEVRYSSATSTELTTGVGLALKKGDLSVKTLVVRDHLESSEEYPAVLPPDVDLPKLGLPGSGPLRYELPGIEPGAYRVCGFVSAMAGSRFTGSEACAAIRVVETPTSRR